MVTTSVVTHVFILAATSPNPLLLDSLFRLQSSEHYTTCHGHEPSSLSTETHIT